jgi:methionyl-tRNA formyltransferase
MLNPSDQPAITVRVVFLGMLGVASLLPLEALLRAGADVRAVVVSAGQPGAQSMRPFHPPRAVSPIPLATPHVERTVLQAAWEHDIPAFGASRFDASAVEQIAAWQPDVICVACFPKRLPASVLALPRYGALNVHPSLLPAHRGPVPLFWTFRAGEQATGVTVHFMNAELDAGDIAMQTPVNLPDGISGPEADQLCGMAGGQLLVETLLQIKHGTLERQPQPPGGSYEPYPHDGDFVIPTSWSARRAFNFMRGTEEWDEPFTIGAGDEHLTVAAALDYDEHAHLNAPFARDGDVVRVQFTPGVLMARIA